MGMFDWVKVPVEIKCPKCGRVVDGWQTKDNYCTLDTVEIGTVDNFYSLCDCGRFVEYRRKTTRSVPPSMDDFEEVGR